MAFEKILILESRWGDDIADTRSTTVIYRSLEALLSLHEKPVRIISLPLIKSYQDDISGFVSLESNRRGPNVIIISAHGRYRSRRKKHGTAGSRLVEGFDSPLNLSADFWKHYRLNPERLKRSIFILDSCEIGKSIKVFLKISGAYGVIGFDREVDWIDSTVFIFALLSKYQERGVFQLERTRLNNGWQTPLPERILEEMEDGAYSTIMDELGVRYEFRTAD